jgi:predicted acetyltransferase
MEGHPDVKNERRKIAKEKLKQIAATLRELNIDPVLILQEQL